MRIRFCLVPLAALICSADSAHATSATEVGAQVGFSGWLFLIPSMIGIKKLLNAEALKDAAEALMQQYRQTTSLLPMDKLIAPDGYLSALAAKGYVITTPPRRDT